MTAYFKDRAIGQIDKVLSNGKTYTAKQIKWLIEAYGDKLPKEVKKGKR